MKRIFRSLIALSLSLCLLICLCGCSLWGAVTGEEMQVSFITDSQEIRVSVPFGDTVSPPLNPKMENRIFSGWYTDASLSEEYDFSTPVIRDLRLYASFVLDGAALTNEITIDVMPALVTVENEYTASGRNMIAQGSGFIYKIENGRAYVLTNCHVAYAAGGAQKLSIEDFQGEKHIATLYQKSPLSAPAIAAEYDLAILTFPYRGDSLKTIPFAEKAAIGGDEVISLGSPGNQSHAITFGEMVGLRSVNLSESAPEESNVTFEIIYHTAAITNGSSGGPLLNGDLALIGVNFAGTEPAEGESFGKGCAVPLEKVQEFLSLYE